jgi:hypothetical protein
MYKMNTNKKTGMGIPRLLGAMFLVVIATSLLMGVLVSLSGSTSDILIKIANNLLPMRLSIFFALVTSIGVVIMAGLLYTVLKKQNKPIALIAFGLWLTEAMALAVSTLGTLGLIPLSQQFVEAGEPGSSFYQTLGNFLYTGIDKTGMDLHMIFYCVGGLLWYYLFFKSRYIPRVISLFGVAAAAVALVGNVIAFFGYDVPIYVSIPLLPFELAIGLWLLIKGVKDQEPAYLREPINEANQLNQDIGL